MSKQPSTKATSSPPSGEAVADAAPADAADAEWAKLSQREKFIRTAREVDADETGEVLDEALRAVGRARKR